MSGESLIPPAYSAQFAARANVRRSVVDGAAHNDIGSFPQSETAIEDFITGLD